MSQWVYWPGGGTPPSCGPCSFWRWSGRRWPPTAWRTAAAAGQWTRSASPWGCTPRTVLNIVWFLPKGDCTQNDLYPKVDAHSMICTPWLLHSQWYVPQEHCTQNDLYPTVQAHTIICTQRSLNTVWLILYPKVPTCNMICTQGPYT